MPACERKQSDAHRRILCTGIAVIDEIFRLADFPQRDEKTRAHDFVSVVGGGAANAAIAIARLGGLARFAGPLGGADGDDPIGNRIIVALTGEGVDCGGCVRVAGVSSPVSAVLVDGGGGRSIIHHRRQILREVEAAAPDLLVGAIDGVLADDHCPRFVTPVCAAARRQGLPVILDIEKPSGPGDALFEAGTHRIFSRSGLCATLGLGIDASIDELRAGLARLASHDGGFVAVTNGPAPVLWHAGGLAGQVSAFPVDVVDTLAAGDIFHGAFALALLESGDAAHALRFAAAAAAIKCTRFGGGATAPDRAEVERLLAASA